MQELAVTTGGDLARLAALLDDLAEQQDAVTRYAVARACATEGFAPSPVCLLRPLGAAVAGLGDRLAGSGRALAARWDGLAADVRATEALLTEADAAAVGRALRLRAEVGS